MKFSSRLALVGLGGALLLAGCNREQTTTASDPATPGEKRYKIGFANLTEDIPFAVRVREGIEKAAKDAGNVDLVIADNKLDGATALANADNFITQGVQGVIEFQTDEKCGKSIMDKMQAKKIPVIAIDIPMPGATFFGVDNPVAGNMAGKGLGEWPAAHAATSQVLARLKADFSSHDIMGSLSVGQQQLVEIAKALSREARILVMDEPTAALTSREVSLLFETIAGLRAQGVGIVYISHRLDEVEEIADRVAVLRDGVAVGEQPMSEVSRAQIVHMMVGREVESHAQSRGVNEREIVLQVASLTRPHRFEDVSFGVRAGEIVGLYGLLGAGQMDVMRALFGSPAAASGEISMNGKNVRIHSVPDAIRAGIGLVSEDRKREGLILGMSVSDNLTLGNWNVVSRNGILNRKVEMERTAHWTQRLGIRARGPSQPVGTLSGGNQQKVVLARWLEAGTKVLLLAEPTRGVDVGARADIYGVLVELREQGLALVMVSTDMEEVLALSDRVLVLVFVRGRIVREFGREEATQELLLASAAGKE